MLKHSTLLTAAVLGLCLNAIPSQAAPAFVTAALRWPGEKAQFFLNDGTFVRYDIAADRADAGFPKPISDITWPGMGPYARQIVAAANAPDPNKVYFFLENGTYTRYDIREGRVDRGYPQAIDNQTWPGMAPYARKVFGALNWGANKIQFFLNDGTYIRYDIKADRVDPGYPQRITQASWPGLAPYSAHLGAAISWTNGKVYFFLDDGRYLRFDIGEDRVDAGYPKPIDERTWPGLHGFFRRRMP